jgi:hypothetical protein
MAAVLSAMDMGAVQMLMTPGERDLKIIVELYEGGIAVDEDTAPDEWADAPPDDPQWVDAEQGRTPLSSVLINAAV